MKSSSNHAWPWAGAGEKAEEIFRKCYPALHAHFATYREPLTNRQDQGQHWWELRPCAYWDDFDKPKVMYQEIMFHPGYMLDVEGRLANNKVFMLPTDDLYLLGVLNSPLLWWHNYRFLPHMKDEAVTPLAIKMQELPIAKPSTAVRTKVESAVARLIACTAELRTGCAEVLAWLLVEFDIEKPNQKLADVAALDAAGLAAEVKKLRGKAKPLSVAEVKRLNEEHHKSVVPLQALAREAAQLEQRIADLVNEAYGLTPDEVKLMWDTAPPRMPTARPDGQARHPHA